MKNKCTRFITILVITCFLSSNALAGMQGDLRLERQQETQCLAPALISSILSRDRENINALLENVDRAGSMSGKPEWANTGKEASLIKKKWVARYMGPWLAQIFMDRTISAGEISKTREDFRLAFRKAVTSVNRDRASPVSPKTVNELLDLSDRIFDELASNGANPDLKAQLARVEIWGSESAEHLTLAPEGNGDMVTEDDSLPFSEVELEAIYKVLGEFENHLAEYGFPENHPKTGKSMRPDYIRYDDQKKPVYKIILRAYGMDGWNYEFENTRQTEYPPLQGKNGRSQPTRSEIIEFINARFQAMGCNDFWVGLNRNTIITIVKKGAEKTRGIRKLLESGPLVYFGDEMSKGNDREVAEMAVTGPALLAVALDKKKKIETKDDPFPAGSAYVGSLTDGLKKTLKRFIEIMKERDTPARPGAEAVGDAFVRAVRETLDRELLAEKGLLEGVEEKLESFRKAAIASGAPLNLAFDSDGTLTAGRGAPIDAEMAGLLAEVMSLTSGKLAVITGKLKDDLKECYIPDDLCLAAHESSRLSAEKSDAVNEKYLGTSEETIIAGVSSAFMKALPSMRETASTVYFPQRMELSEAERSYLEELKKVSNARFVPYSEENMEKIAVDGDVSVIVFSSALSALEDRKSRQDAFAESFLENAKILPVDDTGIDKYENVLLKNGLEILAIGVILANTTEEQIKKKDVQAEHLLEALRSITQKADLELQELANLVGSAEEEDKGRVWFLLNRLLISVPMERIQIQSLNAVRAIYWSA